MLRGYIRHFRAWSAKRQAKLLAAAGVPDKGIYRDSEWPACLNALRPGDVLVVGGGLRVMGENRREIRAAVDAIKAKGAIVRDAETGRTAGGDDGVALMDEAIARLAGERGAPTPKRAREMQKLGLKARTKGRMSKREALTIWRDPALTGPEAIEKMRGWTQASAYRHLGDRQLPAGPRSKRLKK